MLQILRQSWVVTISCSVDCLVSFLALFDAVAVEVLGVGGAKHSRRRISPSLMRHKREVGTFWLALEPKKADTATVNQVGSRELPFLQTREMSLAAWATSPCVISLTGTILQCVREAARALEPN
jgi:hypothetical protein